MVTLDYNIIGAFAMATAILAISPGPDNIFVMVQSMANGKKYGLATVAGLMVGCLVHTTLLAFGVSALIKAHDILFYVIKVMGALYLTYLAYKVWQGDGTIDLDQGKTSKRGLGQLFRKGFLMNVLNPKVTIFFLAFFPSFLFSETMGTIVQFYILGFLFIIVSSFVFGAIALLAAHISSFLSRHKQFGTYLKWIQILVFLGIAIYILFSDK